MPRMATERPERRFWRVYEPVHAVCYFDPAFAAAMVDAGLTGGWNGYFAGRAFPLGAPPAQVVTALFYGFAPAMVARAVPKIWNRISPAAVREARFAAADAVLGAHATAGSTDDLRRVTANLERVVDSLTVDGRALAGAWQSVARPASWFARLWSAVTVLREHRGDGHVVAATACGLTGLQASITHVATGALDRDVLQRNRGWTDGEWADAIEELRERGVLGDDGALTGAGVALRANVERLTDDLATGPWRALDDAEWTMRTLGGLATVLVDRGVVPVPNPMGVPRPA